MEGWTHIQGRVSWWRFEAGPEELGEEGEKLNDGEREGSDG